MPPIPPPRESGFTTTTDVPLYYGVWGPRGAARILVLHGGPGAHHDYLLPQLLELADEYELVFYDQRGGGRSKTDDRKPITWRTHVADLDRAIGELHLEPVVIIGYSWGGLLAMLYAIEAAAGHTEHRPQRLVLIDPAPVNREYRRIFEAEFARRNSDRGVARLRAELAESGLRERDPDAYRQRTFELSVAGYFADPSAAHDLTQFRVTGRVQQSVWDSLGDFDLLAPGKLETVDVPTLILHGRQDPIPVESSEAAAHAMPSAELVLIDGSGHVPYVEQPAALFPPIREFLRSVR
ncbi:MAG TPA: alpha/beta fold hydrolase [Gemmatimonadaceae bacterium]|jgi:proline iminopeptidase|nr:alpha/beta fold hydrolase [Gemmatimonadaceae bacterium]